MGQFYFYSKLSQNRDSGIVGMISKKWPDRMQKILSKSRKFKDIQYDLLLC